MGVYLMAASSFDLNTLLHIAYMCIGLGFVIFVHELGHFAVAKMCGVKCEKFYLGFDIYGLRFFRFRYGETEYGIGALPLGGYVKMLGQDDNPANAERERQRSLAEGTAAEGRLDNETVETVEKPQLDPRSYQAKNVLQRMFIISAGVIMNLIFAVIFAAVAYRMGVAFTPCLIGGTVPGDPAWMQNWEPGTQIVQVGRNGFYDEQLRFDKDLKPKIILNGASPIDLLIRTPGGEEKWVTITPVKKAEQRGYASLGIRALYDLEIGSVGGRRSTSAAAKNELATGDRILAVNGVPVASEPEYMRAIYEKANEKLTLRVERKGEKGAGESAETPSETLEIAVAPIHERWLGFATKIGPVVAVRPDSPAAKAGIEVGDRLVSLGGEPIGDPITLAQRVYTHLNEPLAAEVDRTDAKGDVKTVKLTITPEKPVSPESDAIVGTRAAVESLGLAFEQTAQIAEVRPESPAAKAGLKPCDTITKVEFVPGSEKGAEEDNKVMRQSKVDVGGPTGGNWFLIHHLLQLVQADTQVILTYKRGEESTTTDALATTNYDDWRDPERGIGLATSNRVRTAETWGEAANLGVRETRESMGQVLGVLKGIFTGKVKPTDLGGPLSIAATATSEASVGISSLLIFLTLLSANLAIVNFLPIPVLDGGHFVFLAYEGLRGKPPNERVQLTLTYFGLAFLLLLMAFVFSLDIHRVFTWLTG